MEDCASVSINLETVMPNFKRALKSSEFYSDEIFETTQDFLKMLILDTFTMSTDRHLQNCGIIVSNGDNGKKHIRFSPLIDNECCLMLDIPSKELSSLNNKLFGIGTRANFQEPLIALSENDYDVPNWQNTIEYLADEEIRKDLFDFAEQCSEKLNIEEAIKSVEERIKSKIPDVAKQTATKGFNYRKELIIEALMLDLTINEDPDDLDAINPTDTRNDHNYI